MGAIALPTLGLGMLTGTVGGIISANQQNDAIQSAATTQAAANMQAQDTQKAMYEQTASRLQPYNIAGYQAVTDLQKNIKAPNIKPGELDLPTLDEVAQMYQTLPGYQERLQAGIKARDMSASASGRLGGGGYLKELERYAQDYASNEFNNTYNQLYQNALTNYNAGIDKYNAAWDAYKAKSANAQFLASLGQNAAALTGNAGMTTAANVGNLQSQTGAALASAQAGQQSLLGTGLTGIGNTASTLGLLGSLGFFGSGSGTVNPQLASTAYLGK